MSRKCEEESESLGGEGTNNACSGISNSSFDSKDRLIQVNSRKWKGVDPIVFLKDEVIISKIKTFYGINDDSFPLEGHLVTRNSDANCGKRIYYVSESVKKLLESNFQAGQQLKITYVGLMMFVSSLHSIILSFFLSFMIESKFLTLL